MSRSRRAAARLLAAATAAAPAGCVPEGSPPTHGTGKEAPPQAVSKAEVFRKPIPTGAADDPRVAAAAAAGDAIAEALSVVHRRLTDLKAAYETKARTEGDLLEVAERMKPLVAAARADCDAILRAARDLRTELPYAQKGYAAAAASYRERADGYRDPNLARVTRQMADEFDRLAADAPRKLALTEAFVAQLVDVQEFLAETDRCLTDTATALKVLSAGRAAPEASAEGKTFRLRLEEFLAAVVAYQDALFPKPPPPQEAPPAPALEPPPAPEPASSPKAEKPPEPPASRPADQQPSPAAPPVTSQPVVAFQPPRPKKQAPYPGSNPKKGPAPYPGSRRR